jgi:hypothetical protein
LLFNFALNVTHELLANADDPNIVRENIDTIQKSTEALLDASNWVGLELNPEKIKYMLASHLRRQERAQHKDSE